MPVYDFDQAERDAACVHLQLADQVGTARRGAMVRTAGRVGRVVTFACNGLGQASAWVDFLLATGDVVSLLVPVTQLEAVK